MSFPDFFLQYIEPWIIFLADNPIIIMTQGIMVLLAALIIFLVFYATRDILLRTHSFLYMFFCIILVSALPIVGFLLYLLIRPARTLRERELYAMVEQLSKQPSAKTGTARSKAKKSGPAQKKKKT